VEALPAIYREVIVLRELEGLRYKEIAEVTRVSVGTVMSRLSRARRQLESAVLARDGKEARHDL
jgi:RNA polymerase sigma-70 factor (ECF subfamily)